MLNAWSEYKELSVLPFGGSDLMEQPAFVLEAFKLIEETKVGAELRQAQEAHRRAVRRS